MTLLNVRSLRQFEVLQLVQLQEQFYPSAMHNSVLRIWCSVVYYINGPTVTNTLFLTNKKHRQWEVSSSCSQNSHVSALEGSEQSQAHVPSVQQKSSGLKFSKSRTGSHVMYSCHHNSSRFSFPIFAHLWRFSVFHSLQSITSRIY